MAPRRGAPKVGFRRIDAALDALRTMGFPESKVTRTVNNLLKVYDGDWTFIEEGYYKLVIDVMIQEQEDCPDGDAEAGVESSGVGYSVKDEDEDSGEHDSNSQHVIQAEALPADPPPCIDAPSSMEVDALPKKLKVQDPQVQSRHIVSLPNMDFVNPSPSRNETPQDKLCLTPDVPRPSRQPCYGWISSDDDEDDDLVYSEPAKINPP